MKRMLALALILPLLSMTACAEEAAPTLTLMAVNVGKADCLLLQSGQTRYLIDTGTAESYGAVSAALRQSGVTRLDGVIITHTDKDHAGGAWALASSSIQVGGWYAPSFYTGVKEKKHPMIRAAALRGEEVTWLKAGDTLPLDGGTLTVLGPLAYDGEKENNNSLVLRAQTADGSMLLAGDMEFPEEQSLLAAGAIAPADVLKVGNHGEDDATSDALVAAVKPAVAVISTNSVQEPDTPSTRVLTLLKQAGAKVAVTQSAQEGVQVTLRNGAAETSLLSLDALPAAAEQVTLSDKSVAQDAVCVLNGGQTAADLSGWFIYSDRGGEIFVFPDGTTLPAGQSLSVTSLSSEDPGDFVWQDENVWHKSKDDTAYLFDAYGRLMSELE